jgi:hypothetical protein
VTEGDLIFRNLARERFAGSRFEHFYRAWKVGRVSEEQMLLVMMTMGDKKVLPDHHWGRRLLFLPASSAALSLLPALKVGRKHVFRRISISGKFFR